MDFLSSSTGFLLVIVLPMLLFFIYQVYHLVMVGINLKKAVMVENAAQRGDNSEDAAKRMRDEAEAALAEARRLKEEAEAALAQARKDADNKDVQV